MTLRKQAQFVIIKFSEGKKLSVSLKQSKRNSPSCEDGNESRGVIGCNISSCCGRQCHEPLCHSFLFILVL